MTFKMENIQSYLRISLGRYIFFFYSQWYTIALSIHFHWNLLSFYSSEIKFIDFSRDLILKDKEKKKPVKKLENIPPVYWVL